jgi:2-oxoglutarate ferredoxin oxidoreductase subunit delta
MSKVVIDEKHCKGCGLCVAFCPKGALVISGRLSSRGINAAEHSEGKACSGCCSCAVVCPDAAIEIVGEKTEKKAGKRSPHA